jgi:transposase-like protein
MKSGGPRALSAPERLRAIADALEQGDDLSDIAAWFGVPVRALHKVISPKRFLRRRSKLGPDVLAAAANLIRHGKTFAQAAAALNVPASTLTTAMAKHGLSAKKLRSRSVRDENLQLAILDYQSGVSVPEIRSNRGIPERTLYFHLRKQSIPLRHNRRSAT